MNSENQQDNSPDNLWATSFQLRTDSKDELDLLMESKEAKAKKLIAKRESTQFTYFYTLNGQKVRRSFVITE